MKLKLAGITIAICLIAALASIAMQRGEQIAKYEAELNTVKTELTQVKQEKADLQKRYDEVNKIDKGFQDEIAAIKRDIGNLRDGITSGAIRLRVNVIPAATTATSGNNAGTYELNPALRPDYYTLRSGIMEQQAQIKKLQEYINTQCTRPAK